MAWNVPICMSDVLLPRRFSESRPGRPFATTDLSSILARISSAALLVKVTAVISSGAIPLLPRRWQSLAISVLVLPAPGPAMTATLRPTLSTASRWCWFRLSVLQAIVSVSVPDSGFRRTISPAFSVSICWSKASGTCFLPDPFFITCSSSAVKKLICPSRLLMSSGESSPILPYSPSKPGVRSTFPSRSRRIPSATRGPAAFRISSTGTSRRMANSGPKAPVIRS